MSYEFEVFISYRRAYDWQEWVLTIFQPLLAKWLDLPKGDKDVFLDSRAEQPGLRWPPKIAAAMARSKVLVALWTPNYYAGSHWCRTELDFILERERNCGGAYDLVVPVVLNNPDSLLDDLQLRSPIDVSPFGNIRSTQSRLYEDLGDLIRARLAPAIRERLKSAPPFDAAWDEAAKIATAAAVEATRPAVQRTVPDLGTPPAQGQPAA
jgi:hypothetical protein